jgi:spore maturation protein CgeB
MRIFQVLHSTTNAAIQDNQTWFRNLYDPLLDLGHDVFLFFSKEERIAAKRKNKRYTKNFSQLLFDTFQEEHTRKPFDLFFSYLIDGLIDSTVIDEIHKLGIPTCNFSCNNAHQFYLIKEISKHFDYNLHSEKDARQKFLDIGANPLWFPMASNPKYFKPVNIIRDIDVSFVGTSYALRARYISHLLENNINVQVYGPGWMIGYPHKWGSIFYRYSLLGKSMIANQIENQAYYSGLLFDYDYRRNLYTRFPHNMHFPISDQELITLYSRSQVSLGFLEVYDHHDPSRQVVKHLHLREFEAPMSGAFYITGYSEELAEMYEINKEVVTYKNQYELLDKVKYYLNHLSEAEKIRVAGHNRAVRTHTYHHRYKALFKQIGLTI